MSARAGGRMGFLEAVRTCFRNYVTFSGRASRPEYWYFVLFLLLGGFVAGLLDEALFGPPPEPGQSGVLGSIFSLATLLPALAAGWRRMHDTGRSGLYLFYPLIALVGILTFMGALAGFEPLLRGDVGAVIAAASGLVLILAMLVLLVSPLIVLFWLTRPSQPGANRWGPPPLR